MHPRDIEAVKSLARQWTQASIESLGGIATSGQNEGARVAACNSLLTRGWGQPDTVHTGPDGGDIRITIRTILEGKKKEKP
jgi:hypothetical protein